MPDLINEVADRVRTGECILFLGAGVHASPPEASPYVYPRRQRPPLGGTFSRYLARKCRLLREYPHEKKNRYNLARVSLFFEKMRSRHGLIEEIRYAVDVSRQPSALVRALGDMDFSVIITTNFDQLFETALRSKGKRPLIINYNKNPREATPLIGSAHTPARPLILKIHGDIDEPDNLVITDEDYVHFILRMTEASINFHPVPLAIRSKLQDWPTLFIGYSLMDYNLRLLFQTLRWGVDLANVKPSYSVDLQPDPLVRLVWEHQVRFIVQNAWEFVPELYRRVKGEEMPAQ